MNIHAAKNSRRPHFPMRVAINGFGRIGRAFFRLACSDLEIEIVAIRDRYPIESIPYKLKYDSVHGSFPLDIEFRNGRIYAGEQSPQYFDAGAHKKFSRNSTAFPWKGLNVDAVIEATGSMRTGAALKRHVKAGAKKVILTSLPHKYPASTDCPVYVFGVNENMYNGESVVSASSCSANSAAPLLKIIHDVAAIRHGTLSVIHAYTQDQRLLDSHHGNDFRRGRSAAVNIVPSDSNAATAVSGLIPGLQNRLMGWTTRVPVPDGSLFNIVCDLDRNVTANEINTLVKDAAGGALRRILEYSTHPLVSRDIVNNTHSLVFDSLSTRVMDGSVLRCLAWFDHEYGYAARLVDLAKYVHRGGLR